MRTLVVIAASLGLSVTGAIADPAGKAFCALLLSKVATPTSGEIYYKTSAGHVALFPHNGSYTGSGQPDLFYFRNRQDVKNNERGVISIKISYALSVVDHPGGVNLLNDLRRGPPKCTDIGIDSYERFHGPSREPSSCLRYGFHQTTPFNTLGSSQRVSSFSFGAPDVDTRSLTADLAGYVPTIFSRLSWWLSSKNTPPTAAPMSYRSWIFNYKGQQTRGACVHFQPVITADYGGAKIVANDLLETPDGEILTNQWSVTFGSSR